MNVQNINYVHSLFEAETSNNKITIAFTMSDNRKRNEHNAASELMCDAVSLGSTNTFESIDIGETFGSGKALLSEILAAGGKVAVCESCMVFKGLTASDLDTRFPVIKGSDVIDLTLQSKGSIQIS